MLIHEKFLRGKIDGDVFGIELELEYASVPSLKTLPRGFRAFEDGSLRVGLEWTTTRPYKAPYLKSLLTNLYENEFSEYPQIISSSRASTHVHINVSDMLPQQVGFMCWLFGMVEEGLKSYMAPSRIMNNFCYSLTKAVHAFTDIEKLLRGELFEIDGRWKYTSISLFRLGDLNTAEVRVFENALTPEYAIECLQFCKELRTATCMMEGTDISKWIAEKSVEILDDRGAYTEMVNMFFPSFPQLANVAPVVFPSYFLL